MHALEGTFFLLLCAASLMAVPSDGAHRAKEAIIKKGGGLGVGRQFFFLCTGWWVVLLPGKRANEHEQKTEKERNRAHLPFDLGANGDARRRRGGSSGPGNQGAGSVHPCSFSARPTPDLPAWGLAWELGLAQTPLYHPPSNHASLNRDWTCFWSSVTARRIRSP